MSVGENSLDALIGQTLDRFQILDTIRTGQHWTVYRSFDPKLQRPVAVKVLNSELTKNSTLQERILQAARIAIRLRHPGLARLFDIGQVGEYFYLVSEYLTGVDLRQLMVEMRQSSLKVGLTESILITRDIALAVDYARQRGFPLPDLRISDIMLKPFDEDEHIPEEVPGLPYRPVLVDLGIAVSASANLDDQLTKATPGQELSGPANELYGLVSVLFELVTGKPPDSSPGRQGMPAPLRNLMRRAFSKDSNERFGSADEFAQALTQTLPEIQNLDPNPPSAQGMTSLLAVHQQRAVGIPQLEPMPVVKPEAPPSQEMENEPRLRLLDVDHSVRFIPLRPTGITIGRAKENDVVLNQTEVSRQHAQISFDGTQYRVTDLGSANGSFLNDQKLLAHIPQIWPAGAFLKIGNSLLQLEIPGMPEPTRSVPVGDQTIALEAAQFHVQEGAASLTLSRPNISVIPGQKASLGLIVENRGLIEDLFSLSITGIPADWITQPAEPYRLAPGAQQPVSIDITPPQRSTTRAGRKQLVIQLSSKSAPDSPAEARLNLSIGVFNAYLWTVSPAQFRIEEPFRVQLENRGNATQNFQLACIDAKNEIVFNPPAAKAVVPPGQAVVLDFQPTARQPRLFGSDRTQPVHLRLSGSGFPTETRTFQAVNPVILPAWVWMSMLGVVLVLGFIGLLLIGSVALNGVSGGKTTSSAATSLAEMIRLTQQARLSTEQFLSGANVETLQAITATAVWMDLDNDRDGLSNRQELELKTFPDERDSDQDGLSDGEEFTRGLNPLNPDTDGDLLKDGEEVSRSLDPLSRDTDKDGIPDGTDPDPGRAPTPTFTATIFTSTPTVFTATPTRTSTITPSPTATPTATQTQIVIPQPVINSLSPNNVIMGSPNLNMTVNGSSFVNGSQVLWNGSGRTTTFVNANILLVQIPANDLVAAGNFPVKVRNPAPGGDSGELIFQVRNPQPIISSLIPNSAIVGQNLSEIVINGAGFTSGTRVFFIIGSTSSQRTIKNRTAVALTVEILPSDLATAGTISVSVANDPPGGGSAAMNFSVNNPVPSLNLINPPSTEVTDTTEGITLTLTGNNFIPTSQVVWIEGGNEDNLTTTFDNKTTLRAFVPASKLNSPRTVKIKVVNPPPGGGSSPEELNFQIENKPSSEGWFLHKQKRLAEIRKNIILICF